jgi:hypothetical protein
MHRLETRERPVGVQLNDRVEGGEFSRARAGRSWGAMSIPGNQSRMVLICWPNTVTGTPFN